MVNYVVTAYARPGQEGVAAPNPSSELGSNSKTPCCFIDTILVYTFICILTPPVTTPNSASGHSSLRPKAPQRQSLCPVATKLTQIHDSVIVHCLPTYMSISVQVHLTFATSKLAEKFQ